MFNTEDHASPVLFGCPGLPLTGNKKKKKQRYYTELMSRRFRSNLKSYNTLIAEFEEKKNISEGTIGIQKNSFPENV